LWLFYWFSFISKWAWISCLIIHVSANQKFILLSLYPDRICMYILLLFSPIAEKMTYYLYIKLWQQLDDNCRDNNLALSRYNVHPVSSGKAQNYPILTLKTSLCGRERGQLYAGKMGDHSAGRMLGHLEEQNGEIFCTHNALPMQIMAQRVALWTKYC
jgi:hypothetical protein